MSVVLVPLCVVIFVDRTAPGYGEGSIAKVLDREVSVRVIEEFFENDQHEGLEKSIFNGSVAYQEAILENGGEELGGLELFGIIIPGKVFVNGAEIVQPDIFDNSVKVIHNIGGSLTHLSTKLCNIEEMTTMSFPPQPLESTTGTMMISIMRLMQNDAILWLESIDYRIVALAMKVKYAEISKLKAMTVFAIDDAQSLMSLDSQSVGTSNKHSTVELDFELRLASFYLFFCLKSELVFDGHLYLFEADKSGVVAVVASKEIDIEETLGCKSLVIVEDTNVVITVLNDVMEDRYSVLITLVNQFAAEGFYCSYNGKRFKPTEGEIPLRWPTTLKNMSKEVEDSELADVATVIGNILSHLGAARDVVLASATCRKWHEAYCKHLLTLSLNSEDRLN
nr:fasciclin-like arabinogalactan protein 21 [Ipomoea batatas]